MFFSYIVLSAKFKYNKVSARMNILISTYYINIQGR